MAFNALQNFSPSYLFQNSNLSDIWMWKKSIFFNALRTKVIFHPKLSWIFNWQSNQKIQLHQVRKSTIFGRGSHIPRKNQSPFNLIKVVHICWEVNCLPAQKRKCPDFPICDSFWVSVKNCLVQGNHVKIAEEFSLSIWWLRKFGLYCPPTEFWYMFSLGFSGNARFSIFKSVDSANLGESHAQNDSRRGRGVKERKLGSK